MESGKTSSKKQVQSVLQEKSFRFLRVANSNAQIDNPRYLGHLRYCCSAILKVLTQNLYQFQSKVRSQSPANLKIYAHWQSCGEYKKKLCFALIKRRGEWKKTWCLLDIFNTTLAPDGVCRAFKRIVEPFTSAEFLLLFLELKFLHWRESLIV